MKNKLLIIITAAICLCSCNKDYLNLVPETSLSSASFFKDQTQFNQALTSAYTPLRTIVHTGIYMDEMRSDNTFFTVYLANRGLETSTEYLAEFLDDANSSATPNSPGNRWGNDYSGIAMTNTILDRVTTASFLSQGAVDSISGEALFLRAFYYYDLVTHYGGVPLQLKEVASADESFQPKNTVDEVYTQIIADLTSAISKLPVAATFPQSGRVTKGAADVLIAYAYMSGPNKDYAKAEAALKEVTNMNYTLLPNYADVFDPQHKNNQESIFEVQYMSDLTSGQQSDFAWEFIPKSVNPEVLTGFHGSSMDIWSGWNVPTDEMVSSYEKGDLRLPVSIGVAEGTISGVEDFTIDDSKSPVGFVPTPGKTYFYYVKKYLHPPYSVEFNTDDDWPVFRYSGALLLLAECLVDENKNAEALPYLNRVRERAGLPDLAAATTDNIANERRHELAFENHRWTDLIRIGQAIDKCTAKGVLLKAKFGWLLPQSFKVTQDKLIYPIPAREIQINTKLVQNPGY